MPEHKKGLINFDRFDDPEGMKKAFEEYSEKISKLIGSDTKLILVQDVSDELMEDLMRMQNEFLQDVMYTKSFLVEISKNFEDVALVVAYTGKKFVLVFLLYRNQSVGEKSCFLDCQIVDGEFQFKGVGKKMLELSSIMAKGLGYRKVVLFCRERGKNGINLPEYYIKRGFRSTGLVDPARGLCMYKEIESK